MNVLRLFAMCAMLLVTSARAQVFTIDLQAIAQQQILSSIGQDQVGALGQILQVNNDQLTTAQRINQVLGSPGSTQLASLRGSDMQSLLRGIPGLENLNVASVFPPNVAGAFLGRSFAQWRDMIANPSSLFASELRRMAVGDLATAAGAKSDERAFLQYVASANGRADKTQVALAVSRMLASRLMESVSTQGEQAAVYAAKTESFSEEAKKNLTITDRAKLSNNQSILSLELQLQQLQAQTAANAASAGQLDAQTRLLEEQLNREEVDRASRN